MPWFRGERPRIIARGDIVIGSRFQVDGLCERVEFGAMDGAVLRIGDDVRLNRGATVVAFERIELGDHVRVGSDVSILDSAIHEVDEGVAPAHAPVIIEENVWLARGVIVLPGVEIGRHSVIGAGAVVTASIPARSLAVGNPARVVRQVHASDHWVRA